MINRDALADLTDPLNVKYVVFLACIDELKHFNAVVADETHVIISNSAGASRPLHKELVVFAAVPGREIAAIDWK